MIYYEMKEHFHYLQQNIFLFSLWNNKTSTTWDKWQWEVLNNCAKSLWAEIFPVLKTKFSIAVNNHLPMMFPHTDFLFEKQIGLVSTDLLYIIFTYYTQDNQQECFRLSNWFFLLCLWPQMNHLPPVWWSNFSFFNVSKWKLVCKFHIVESTKYYHFHRHSLYSFLLHAMYLTGPLTVCSKVSSGQQWRKHQISALLALVIGIHPRQRASKVESLSMSLYHHAKAEQELSLLGVDSGSV